MAGTRVLGSGFRLSESDGFWNPGSGFLVLGTPKWVPGSRSRVLGSGFWVLIFGWVLEPGFWVLVGFWVLGSARILGSGF